MLNFFKKSTEKQTEDNNQTGAVVNNANESVQQSEQEEKAVHGEKGVCCGGCGGQ